LGFDLKGKISQINPKSLFLIVGNCCFLYNRHIKSIVCPCYSLLKDFTGLEEAAMMDWYAIVRKARAKVANPAPK
jgi:hypothetical protein